MIAVILYHIMLMNALLDECVQCHGMTTEDGSIQDPSQFLDTFVADVKFVNLS